MQTCTVGAEPKGSDGWGVGGLWLAQELFWPLVKGRGAGRWGRDVASRAVVGSGPSWAQEDITALLWGTDNLCFFLCPRASERLERPSRPEQSCQEEEGTLGNPVLTQLSAHHLKSSNLSCSWETCWQEKDKKRVSSKQKLRLMRRNGHYASPTCILSQNT